ncbi:thymidine kinase [Priestia megaterium]|nr:thymidine kinase [Priestia megaterium]
MTKLIHHEKQKGKLTCHHGNMFGGKSTALIREFRSLTHAVKAKVAIAMEKQTSYTVKNAEAFVHVRDDRYSKNATTITTHDGDEIPAIPVSSGYDILDYVRKHQIDIIAIDEIQFFIEEDENGEWIIISTLLDLLDQGKTIIVAGLTYNFRRMPFGPIGDILLISDEQHMHLSKCSICNQPARYPQRLIDGKPAFKDEPLIKVGGSNDYKPRCDAHHELPVRPVVVKPASVSNHVG